MVYFSHTKTDMNTQFPIGKLSYSENYSAEDLHQWIQDISLLPTRK